MAEWSPEVVVGEELARSLAGDRLPAFRDAPMRLLGEGWDSTVWLLGDEWVLRFPRREVVVPGFLRELQVLPRIAPRLPFAVPVAAVRGEPDARFPWPWSAHRLLPGHEIPDARPDDAARVRNGRDLGRFLRALHGVDPAELRPGGEPLPVDPVRRADMPYRVDLTERRLRRLADRRLWTAPAALAGVLAEARALPPPGRLTLCHGDLHLRHLLVSDEGELCGVIDWIDVCRADPAIDLPLYWGHLSPEGRAAFRAEYGPVEPDGLLRARVLAVFLWGTLADYAHDVGMPALQREALRGLDRAVADLG
jgi:aminoglycoside phosphotransferase (APT) family kinase protein